jgi:glycosyltransferase involved in cell wall biosynthesis
MAEPGRQNVLIITPDSLGVHMAGPAIRAYEMARALSSVCSVRLVSTVRCDGLEHPAFHISHADDAVLRDHADWADVIVFQGHILSSHPWLQAERFTLVADIYDPMHLEVLEQGKDLNEEDRLEFTLQTAEVLNTQLERSDFMVCASGKQRDFWLGQLAGLGRINPATYEDDHTLRRLIDVAPFGIADEAPSQRSHGIKGTVKGISEDDTVVIWGGGIYNWFDPITLIRAVDLVSRTHPDLRLFFLGAKHPNPDVPEMQVAFQARQLAVELGLLDRVVFFNEGWVPYENRADYLLDADLGVSTHFEHLETAFSFRTRILDYLWASLPIVSTEGDTFGELIAKFDLGKVVPPEDVEALASALEDVLYRPGERQRLAGNVAAFAQQMRWSEVLRPLVSYCRNPYRAPDKVLGVLSPRNRHARSLQVRIRGLEQSTSWKVTRPLRWLSDLPKRIR